LGIGEAGGRSDILGKFTGNGLIASLVLHLSEGENRYNADSVTELTRLVAQVAVFDSPSALMLVGDGKFWSNGLDREWFESHRVQAASVLAQLHVL